MPDIAALARVIFAVAVRYSSVVHAGASRYLACCGASVLALVSGVTEAGGGIFLNPLLLSPGLPGPKMGVCRTAELTLRRLLSLVLVISWVELILVRR